MAAKEIGKKEKLDSTKTRSNTSLKKKKQKSKLIAYAGQCMEQPTSRQVTFVFKPQF